MTDEASSQTIVLEHASRLIVRRLVGVFDYGALVAALEELEASAGFDPDWDVLSDFSGARIQLEAVEARLLAERQDAMPRVGGRRWAMVVPRDAEYGLGRLTLAYVKSAQASVFRTEDEARAWIAGRER